MDLRMDYHLIRVKKGDEWKMACCYYYSLYEFMVMPFGLTNTPATFQDMMNHILKDLLDKSIIVYIDAILIYAKAKEKHNIFVKEV
jgi:hypothetical protein